MAKKCNFLTKKLIKNSKKMLKNAKISTTVVAKLKIYKKMQIFDDFFKV